MVDGPPSENTTRTAQEISAVVSDGKAWFTEKEEEAPVRRLRDGGAAARRARLDKTRLDVERAVAGSVVREEVDHRDHCLGCLVLCSPGWSCVGRGWLP